jgi:hypothetical protein
MYIPLSKKKKEEKIRSIMGSFGSLLSLSLYLSLDKLQRGTKASMRRLQQHTDKMAHWRPMRSHLIISFFLVASVVCTAHRFAKTNEWLILIKVTFFPQYIYIYISWHVNSREKSIQEMGIHGSCNTNLLSLYDQNTLTGDIIGYKMCFSIKFNNIIGKQFTNTTNIFS